MEAPPTTARRRLAFIRRTLLHRYGSRDHQLGAAPLVAPHPAMHSSNVRDEDFRVVDRGRALDLRSFLPSVDCRTRVGVIAPDSGTEGAGAAALILAMITAFYDDLRATETDFFDYPDFFVFQPAGRSKLAPYSMFGA